MTRDAMGTYHGGGRAAGGVSGWRRLGGRVPREVTGAAPKAVVQPGDLTYVGSWSVPYVPALQAGRTFDPAQTRGLSHRYVGGALRYLVLGYVNAYPEQVAEVRGEVALRTVAPYNRPNWYGTGAICYGNGGYDDAYTTDASVEAIRWDAVGQRLYWTQVRGYAGPHDPPTTGYVTLTTPPGDEMSVQTGGLGAVRMATSTYDYGTRYVKDVILLPDWFVAALPVPGCRLGLGCGGSLSTLATGPVSMGPALVATTPLEAGVDVQAGYRDTAPRVRLVHHPWHGAGWPVPPTFGRRDPNYWTQVYATNVLWNPTGGPGSGTGYFCNNDFLTGHGVWIETATKTGFLVFPRFVTGWGLTTVTAAPSLSQITVADASRYLVQDLILIDNGYLRPGGNGAFDDLGLGEQRRVTAISGNTLTLSSPLAQLPPIGNRVLSGEWYYNGGGGITRMRPAWICYDPYQLLRVARGELTWDAVDWAWDQSANYPGAQPYGWGGDNDWTVRGATFDDVTSRLSILVGQHVHVYQVS